MPITIFIDTCTAVEVLDSKQTHDDDNGRYFYLTDADFAKMVGDEVLVETDKMVGDEVLDKYQFDVIQVGSRHWVGRVVAWKGDGGSDVYGERESGSSHGQWAAGDKMILQTCNGETPLFRIIY